MRSKFGRFLSRLNLKFAFGKTFKIKPEFYQLVGGLTVTNFTWTI
ncbi:hypothetical protein CAMRE0001_0663 [Campylobacter rectus RM3267]|uniref:Uncharacterized protein n=1 Tax=Campylobacter rectus RM3267 TaxID=553218 RepID=B9D1K0_CAMRE|nr:hypothetical protein CAMRE0001_0663 [Campylobacter rectus RM3267]